MPRSTAAKQPTQTARSTAANQPVRTARSTVAKQPTRSAKSGSTPAKQPTRSAQSPSDPRPEPTGIPKGYGVPTSRKGLLPWSWARERLEKALSYWLVTTFPDGRPHSIPTWGAWVDDRFYCEGSPETRYAKNIERNPRVVVHLESADVVVIVDGVAKQLDDISDDLTARVLKGYAKYRKSKNYEADPANWREGGFWQITPIVARGWARLDEATRWRFDR